MAAMSADAHPPWRVLPLEFIMNHAMAAVEAVDPGLRNRQLRYVDDEAVVGTWEAIENAMLFSLAFYAVTLVFFEIFLRRPLWWLYASRNGHPTYKSSTPPVCRGIFSWVPLMVGETIDTDEVIFERWGTDALVFLHMMRFFIRSLSFASLVGCCMLLPVYYYADEPDSIYIIFFGFHKTTMSKILEPGPRLWAPVVAAYLMTIHTLFLLNRFYKNFVKWRFRHLVTTASAFTVANRHTALQESLSVLVENIPDNLQSSDKLNRYFNKLFPGQVHSAVVMLRNTGPLTTLVNRYRRLELMMDEMIIQQSKLRDGERVRQCWWFCGQPKQCLCCCIGHPGRCFFQRCRQGCFTDSEPTLKQAMADTKAAIITTFRQRMKQMDEEMSNRVVDEDLDVSSQGTMRSSRASRMSINISDVEWLGKLVPITLKEMAFDEESTDADYRLANLRDKGMEQWLDEVNKVVTARGERGATRAASNPEFATISLQDSEEAAQRATEQSDSRPSELGRMTTTEVLGGMSNVSVRDLEDIAIKSGAYTRRGAGAGVFDGTGGDGIFTKDPDAVPRYSTEQLRRSFLAQNTTSAIVRGLCNIIKFFPRQLRVLCEDSAEGFVTIGKIWNDLFVGAGTTMERVGTGFVTFTSHVSKSNAVKAQLFREPFAMQCKSAPEVRDVIFENVAVPARRIETRVIFTRAMLGLGALFWSAVTVFIAGLPEIMDNTLDVENKEANWYVFLSEHVPVLTLLLLLNLLPLIFTLLGRYYEQRKSISQVDLSVVRRYFDYLMANLYVSLMAASVIESAHQAVQESLRSPLKIVALIGANIAYSGSFFMNFLVIQCGMSPLWLWRLWPLVSRGWFEPAQPVEVPSVPFGWAIPKQLLIFLIACTYWTIAPLLVPVALLLFISNNIFFRFLIVWSHMPHYETGGQFWYITFNRIIIGLALSALFNLMAIWLKGGLDQTFALLPLPFIILGFGEFCRRAYEMPSKEMARADAIDHDNFISAMEKRNPDARKASDGFSKYLYAQPSITRGNIFHKMDKKQDKMGTAQNDGAGGGGGYVEEVTFQPMHQHASQEGKQHEFPDGGQAGWANEETGYVPAVLSSEVTHLDELDSAANSPGVEMGSPTEV